MDRLAAHIVATAVLTAALAAVPAAMATATSAAKPTSGTSAPTTTSAAGSASAVPSTSSSAQKSTGPKSSTAPTVQATPCSDAYQVGVTAYTHWHGIVAFSVKQFYSPSCHAVYGYTYPWLQFRRLNASYDVGTAVFDVTHDAIDGARTFVGGAGGPDFWSEPVTVPAKTCTEGLSHVFFPDDETDTYTAKFCQ